MTTLEMKYFVLKPKGDTPYAAASRAAMYAYADAIEHEDHQLFLDLIKWAQQEEVYLRFPDGQEFDYTP